eukprot:scaffold30163_cov124-Isochrysis_galbana.AAC.9
MAIFCAVDRSHLRGSGWWPSRSGRQSGGTSGRRPENRRSRQARPSCSPHSLSTRTSSGRWRARAPRSWAKHAEEPRREAKCALVCVHRWASPAGGGVRRPQRVRERHPSSERERCGMSTRGCRVARTAPSHELVQGGPNWMARRRESGPSRPASRP